MCECVSESAFVFVVLCLFCCVHFFVQELEEVKRLNDVKQFDLLVSE